MEHKFPKLTMKFMDIIRIEDAIKDTHIRDANRNELETTGSKY